MFLVLQLDDWVLCRIYKKSQALTSSPRALISSEHDQEEEEEQQQFVQETISNKNPLMSQKSCSFSNLFDAMDYSMCSSFLADTSFNPIGYFESNPTLNSTATQLDQPFFSNSNSASNSNNTSSGTSCLQKLPQLNTSMPNMQGNKLKRQLPHVDEDLLHPSKKFMNSCSFTNTNNNTQTDMGQYNFLSQTFLDQQLLLSPHLQFLG